MIRTQVRCDKRVSFRDRREGWTCVCPSPGVARTHMATRTVSLRAGNPRQAWTRPSPTAPMRWRVLRSTNAGCNHTGLSGGSRPQHQAATTHKRPMLHTPLRHRRTLGKTTKPRHHRRRPTISYIIVTPRSSNLRCGRLPRRAEISTGFGFSPNASSTSSSFRTRSGDQVWNLLSRADWPTLGQPRTLRCQPAALGQRLTNGLWGPL